MDRRLIACLPLLTVLALGCGAGGAGGPASQGASATTVSSISMTRSGGEAGVQEDWRLAPGDEFSEQAFEVAARRSQLEAEVAEIDPETMCCDFFVYDVMVRYADGDTLRATLDEDPEATVWWELVEAVEDSSRAQPTSQHPADTTDPTEPPAPEDDSATTVSSISMTRSGGIAGVRDSWRLAPGDEFSEQAFEVAARRSQLEAEVAELDQEPICCDFFVYDVTVRYADGDTLRATLDEDPEATAWWELVHAVEDSSRAEPDQPVE